MVSPQPLTRGAPLRVALSFDASIISSSIVPSILQLGCIFLHKHTFRLLSRMIDLKHSPRIAKGRQRLEDLRCAAAKANAEHRQPQLSSLTRKALSTRDRGQSLRERLRAKEERNLFSPLPPTKAEQERQAALQQVPNVLPILSMTTSCGTRQSQSLPMLVQKIQHSARSPMARSEVERCLDVLATEIAPDFVQIIRTGGVTAVVVDHAHRPTDVVDRINSAVRLETFEKSTAPLVSGSINRDRHERSPAHPHS